ncbi:MAG: diguanylate cyclase [Gammaproteobacteria bacterium]|nr:diguanylate cyclase [Gammaproteobacteria bacterium]
MNNDKDIDHLANIFDLLYDGVVIIDKDSNIVFANTGCQRIFGFSKTALMGESLDMLIPAQHRQHHCQHIEAYKKHPTPRLMSDRAVLFGLNNLGEEVPVTISITAFNNGSAYLIAIIRDGALLKQQFEQEKELAETDVLTQLGNRRYLSRMFEELSKKPQSQFAVLFIDLDNFKPVNDDYGHEVGDQALKIISKRLNAVLRRYDIVVRIGGDEFAVLLCNIHDHNSIKPIIRKVIHSISRPIHAQQLTLTVGASIGCALYPEDGKTEKELLNKSDSAMYHAKSRQTGFCFFSDLQHLEGTPKL